MTTEPVKGLRPCPFCGGNIKEDCFDKADGICIAHSCDKFCGEELYGSLEEWNKAYCWQQSDRDKARIAELEGALNKITNTLPGELIDWDIYRRIAKDALKKTGEE